MAYYDRYLDLLKARRGGRITAYQDPTQDPTQVLGPTSDYWNRQYRAKGGRPPTSPYVALALPPMGTDPDPDLQQRLRSVTGSALQQPRQLDVQPGPVWQLPASQPSLPTRQFVGGPEGADEPKSFLSKIGGFLTRPGVGGALSTLGAGIATESSRPGGSFWTGLAQGSAAAAAGEQQRQVIEQQQQAAERNRRQEDEDRAIQKAAQERVREVIDQLGPDATPEERASGLLRASTEAAAGGNTNLSNAIRLIAEQTAPPEIGASYTGWAYMGGTGYAVEGPGGEWVPATGGQQGVPGRWRTRTNKFTGVEEREFVPIGEAPEDATEVGGRDSDIGRQTAAVAIAGLKILKPFTLSMAGLDLTGERVRGIEGFQGLLASTMDEAIGDVSANWLVRAFKAKTRQVLTDSQSEFVNEIIAGQLAALAVVNPMVRWLSGAQMTNQETSRYYKALIPAWGNDARMVRIKVLGLETLAAAMEGNLEAIDRMGGLGVKIRPRGDDESEESWQARLGSYAQGQAAQLYNASERYLDELDAKDAAGPQFGNN
jgi:hypothetical protein